MKKLIALLLVTFLFLTSCACTSTGDVTSGSNITSQIESTTTSQNDNSTPSNNNNESTVTNTSNGVSSSDDSSQSSSEADPNASETPRFTLFARVSDNVYIVGGVCSTKTEYVTIGGAGVNSVKVTPMKGKDNNYFISQVKINSNTNIEIQGKESGKSISNKAYRFAMVTYYGDNLMTEHDYRPVFGLDNRMHYYSSILSYTMSDKVNKNMKQTAVNNISATIESAKSVGAEVIYLVVPSSAAVYPETLPAEYKAATGETIYKAFEGVATQCGAKVIYPLDLMKSHKNDGDGYKIYSHTDSHWTTYGAYWGVNALMSYVDDKYSAAAPRSVSDMGFYTAELYAGDALFSFDDNRGFENYSYAASTGGETKITGIKELTTLYNLKMPTDTISKITRGKKSVYLTKDNEDAKIETNSSGANLPSAVIVRDSFGRTAYDMINDRFSKVAWLAEGDYESVHNVIYANQPNYVIYIVSERNLLKVMLNNKDVSLSTMQ